MDYVRLSGSVPLNKRVALAYKLVDVVLLSKNDEKMPSHMANVILHNWQKDTLPTEPGLAALLEVAVLMEPEKTLEVVAELELPNLAEQIKKAALRS